MSYTESPEMRQIRELRNQINYLTKQRNTPNPALTRALASARKEIEQANRRYEESLRAQDRRNREQERQIQAQNRTISALDEQMREKERLQNEKLRQIQAQHQEDIRQLNEDFHMENRKLCEAVRSTRQEMYEGFRRVEEQTDQKIASQRRETDRKIQDLNRQMTAKIKNVDAKVDDLIGQIQAKEQGEQELAQYWIQQAVRLLKELSENYRPQLFTARAYEKLRQRIDMAQNDIDQKRFSSAADGGRAVFYEALDLKEELVLAETEWNYWFNALKEREVRLLEMLSESENRAYELNVGGEQVTDTSGVDYWTNGQLSVFRDRVEKFRGKLHDLGEKDTEYIRKQAEAALGLMEELTLIENAAHTNVAMSVSRYEMAEKIGAILGEDFQMIDSDGDYFGEENRDEYHAIFENPVTGDQTAIVITPIPGEDGTVTNHVEVIVGNADNNPVTRQKINLAVQHKLSAQGLEQVSFLCSEKYGERTREEAARVGNIGAVTAGVTSARSSVSGRTAVSGKEAAPERTAVSANKAVSGKITAGRFGNTGGR